MKHIKLFEAFLFEGEVYQYKNVYVDSIQDPAEKAKCLLPSTSTPLDLQKFLNSQRKYAVIKVEQDYQGIPMSSTWKIRFIREDSQKKSKSYRYYIYITYPLWLDEKGIRCDRNNPSYKIVERTQEWIEENLDLDLPLPRTDKPGYAINQENINKIRNKKIKLENWIKENPGIVTQSGDIFTFDLTKKKDVQFPAKPEDILTKFTIVMGLTPYTISDNADKKKEVCKKIFSNWTTGEFEDEFKQNFNNRAKFAEQ